MKGSDMMPRPSAARRPRRHAAAGALLLGACLLGTTGCVRFGAKAPDRLLAVSAHSSVQPGQAIAESNDTALFVDLPAVPRTLATPRVAVRQDATSYAYVKDAIWVDLPSRQFQSLLAETIRARLNRLVLDPGQFLARRGQMLEGSLSEFGIDAASRRAVVTYDAALMSADGQRIVRQRFTAAVPVATIDAGSVAPAIDEAANQVAVAVADWIRTQGG